jgi:hypothetical protein
LRRLAVTEIRPDIRPRLPHPPQTNRSSISKNTPTPHTDSPDSELTHHEAALTIGERRKPAYS